MKIQDIRTKTESELRELVIKAKQEMMNLRFQKTNGQLTSTSRFKGARVEIAKIKTVLSERRIDALKGVK